MPSRYSYVATTLVNAMTAYCKVVSTDSSVFMCGYGLIETVFFQFEHNFIFFYPLTATAMMYQARRSKEESTEETLECDGIAKESSEETIENVAEVLSEEVTTGE